MHLNVRTRDGRQAHAPRQRRLRAEGLAVHEVAPAADELADKQADDDEVGHGEELKSLLALAPAQAQRDDDDGDDRPVDGETAVPDGDGLAPAERAVAVFEVVEIEQHIVNPRAEDAAGDAPEHAVEEVILADAVFLLLAHAKRQRQHKAERDENAVPVDAAAADVQRHGAGRELPVAEKPREADGAVCHNAQGDGSSFG